MKPTCAIYVGEPLRGEEAHFLRTLCGDFAETETLILANFVVGDQQIDFVVVTRDRAAVLELKNYSRPIFGSQNGRWSFENLAGQRVAYDGNPYQQVIQQKFALSDAMREYAKTNASVPRSLGKGFYADLDAFVCVYPRIHERSNVSSGDHKASVRSYPDIVESYRSGGKPSSWTIECWAAFAQTHLRLDCVTLEQAVDAKVREVGVVLDDFRRRVRSLFSAKLPPLLPSQPGDNYGSALIETLCGAQNFLLVGPSGAAKTFHAHHLCLALAESERELPLFVEARSHTAGDFKAAFRRSIAPLYPRDAGDLLANLRLCALTPVVILDGVNECDERHRDELLHGLRKFQMQFGGRVVVTSQTMVELGPDLNASVLQLKLPDAAQKRLIYAHHASVAASADLDALCGGFANTYELTLAGRCHQSGGAPESTCELYDRYVRRCLPRHTSVAAGVLCRVAADMAARVSALCTRQVFDGIAESFVREQQASVAVLDELTACGLVRFTDEAAVFEHELLGAYFRAEALRREFADVSRLSEELLRPRNYALAEFLIARFGDRAEVASLLSHATGDVLNRVAAGACGKTALAVLMEECIALFQTASSDLPSLRVDCTAFRRGNGRAGLRHIVVAGEHVWSPYETLLCQVIARSLELPTIRQHFFDLLDRTEWALRVGARRSAAEAGFKTTSVWEEMVRLYAGLVQHGTMRLPLTAILGHLRMALMCRHQALDPETRRELIERARRQPQSDFSLLLLLNDRASAERADRADENIDVIERAVRSAIYILEVSGLEYLQLMTTTVSEERPDLLSRVKALLDSVDTGNVLLNTALIETMSSYELIDSPVSADEAAEEMRLAITLSPGDDRLVEVARSAETTPEQVLSMLAARSLGNIFEDVFQGAYFSAYDALSSAEKESLLIRAAAAEEPGMLSTWILGELLKNGGQRSLATFERFAAGVDSGTPFRQEAVAAFILGIKGCAQLADDPPRYSRGASAHDQAWRCVGEALFRIFKVDSNGACADAWEQVHDEVRLALPDVLYQVESAKMLIVDKVPDLVAVFGKELLPILEYCLARRDELTTFFPPSLEPAVVRFLIRSVGSIGNAAALPILREAAEDPVFGPDAVAAIDEIERTAMQKQKNGRTGSPAQR